MTIGHAHPDFVILTISFITQQTFCVISILLRREHCSVERRQKMRRGTILSYYVTTARRFGYFPSDTRTSDHKITQMNSSFFVPPILFGIFVLWYSNFILETITISFKLFRGNGNDQSQNIKILCKTDGTDSAEGYCCSFYSFTLTMLHWLGLLSFEEKKE